MTGKALSRFSSFSIYFISSKYFNYYYFAKKNFQSPYLILFYLLFRLHPVAVSLQRYIAEDIIIQNYHIPAGVRSSYTFNHFEHFYCNSFVLSVCLCV